MFDRTTLHVPIRGDGGHYSVDVRRAPTDESVKLLREMETAARASVDETIRVADNGFECVLHLWKDHLSASTVCRCIFSLNGQKMDVIVTEPGSGDDPSVWVPRIRDAVAKAITEHVLVRAFAKMVVE